MPISNLLFREKTNVPVKNVITFNAPGIYYPPYGKTSFLLQGQGATGTAAVPNTVAQYFPASGGNYAYTNAASGGNYAGTNAASGGNYAGTNATTGGNYAGTNATTPGNPVNIIAGEYRTYQSNAFGLWNPATPNAPAQYAPAGSMAYSYWTITTSYPKPAVYYYSSNTPAGWTQVLFFYVSTVNYNPTIPGTAYYNPTIPGTAYYNPATPGNVVNNPYVAAYSNYNPYVPATNGAPSNILGVTLPGGTAAAAPVVGYVPISSVSYSNAGYPITVPSGGYVKIQNV